MCDMFRSNLYYVVRTHSHTDRQCLWKVMSRGFKEENEALLWMDYENGEEKNKDHQFMVVLMTASTEDETI